MATRVNIVDSFFHHAEHEIINTSLLIMVARCYKNVHYFGSASSIHNLKKLLTEQHKTYLFDYIKFKTIKLSKPGSKDLHRNLISALYNIWYTIILPSNQLTIFNYNNYLSGHLINLISRILNRRVMICGHAEIEMLGYEIPSRKIALKQRLLIHLFKKIKWSQHLRFLVFGNSIINNLQNILNIDVWNKILSIDHPYFSPFEGLTSKVGIQESRIGVVGVIKREKGLHNLLEIATSLQKEIKYKLLNITTISKVVGDISVLQELGIVIYNTSGKLLSREEYSQAVSSVDFVYFPYERNSYRLTASGAVFESIFSEKPIIALRNDFFDYLFDKYGEFGILCNSNIDLAEKIREIMKGQIKSDDFITNIRRIKTELEPEFISCSFKNQILKHYPNFKSS